MAQDVANNQDFEGMLNIYQNVEDSGLDSDVHAPSFDIFISQKKSLNSNEAEVEAEKPTGGLKKSCSVPFCDLMRAAKALKN